MDLTQIDKNFAAAKVEEDGFIFFDVQQLPISLEGLPWLAENHGEYYRIPLSITKEETSEGVLELSHKSAGVCARFRSNSKEIMIRSTLAYSWEMNHMPRSSSMGFDCYRALPSEELIFNKCVQPDHAQVYVKALAGVNPNGLLCDWVVNFPLYGGVSKVEIGIKADAQMLAPKAHRITKPILFYGSSITQGGCATRPGNMYPSMLCRKLDAEQINLGFSGCAKGEPAMAKLIASLDLSLFVLDYDWNAIEPEFLEATHEPFFKIVREAHPTLPIIMLSRPDVQYRDDSEVCKLRRDIVKRTWEHAVEAGDKHSYFIDGYSLLAGEMSDACTVDGCHPNDFGFYRMYRRVMDLIEAEHIFA